jgi:cytoskeleton protein RodZ
VVTEPESRAGPKSGARNTGGKRLRAAREQAGLTVDDVARELRLTVARIKALEEDRHDALAGMTYVRGYLRSYARLLGLPEASVLPPTEAEPVTDTGRFSPVAPRQVRSTDRHMRLITLLLGLALAGLLLTWWHGRSTEAPVTMTAKAPPANLESEPTPLPATGEPVAPGVRAPGPADVISGGSEPSAAPVNAEPPATVAVELEQKPVAVTAPPATRTSDVAGVAGLPAREAETATPSPVSAAPKPAAAPAPRAMQPEAVAAKPAVKTAARPKKKPVAQTEQKIRLQFSDTSWVDVRDSDDKRLVYQSVTGGQDLTLAGKPPFRIFLGNAGAVKMEYGGRPVDINAYQTGMYARFVLGDNSKP